MVDRATRSMGVPFLRPGGCRRPGSTRGSPEELLAWGHAWRWSDGEATLELGFDARRRLSYVRIWPFHQLSRDELQKIAGPLQSRRYDFAVCSEDDDSAPLVERADGRFEYLVSPEKGLSAPTRGDMVERIELSLVPPDGGTCP